MYKMGHIDIVHRILVDPSMTYMYKMRNINIGHKIFVDPSMTYIYKMCHITIGHKIFIEDIYDMHVQDGSYRSRT